MKLVSIASLLLVLCASQALPQQPFLTDSQWTALKYESNGAAPYENLRYITTLHRVPATSAFDQAAQFILERARDYGLTDVHSEQFPTDGTKQYGLMRSYLGWNVVAASLWQTKPEHLLLGDWETNPITLADYSRSADSETTLVDVGDGTSERDYAGKDVRGKIVLADGVLARVQELAIAQHGAIGILSDFTPSIERMRSCSVCGPLKRWLMRSFQRRSVGRVPSQRSTMFTCLMRPTRLSCCKIVSPTFFVGLSASRGTVRFGLPSADMTKLRCARIFT